MDFNPPLSPFIKGGAIGIIKIEVDWRIKNGTEKDKNPSHG
jgi:hypothetical protein